MYKRGVRHVAGRRHLPERHVRLVVQVGQFLATVRLYSASILADDCTEGCQIGFGRASRLKADLPMVFDRTDVGTYVAELPTR